MTTLQEALAAPGCERIKDFYNTDPVQMASVESFVAALAQQELPQKERPDFMAGYDAGMADAKRMAQQGEPVCAGCGIPAGDVHMSTCKSGKWSSRVSNGDTAAPAPQPAHEPTRPKFFCGVDVEGSVISVSVLMRNEDDVATLIHSEQINLAAPQPAPQAQDKSDNYLSGYCTGRTDLLKEQSAQPVAQPLTDEQIFSAVKPLYGTDESATMGRIDDLATARAIEAAHGIREVK